MIRLATGVLAASAVVGLGVAIAQASSSPRVDPGRSAPPNPAVQYLANMPILSGPGPEAGTDADRPTLPGGLRR